PAARRRAGLAVGAEQPQALTRHPGGRPRWSSAQAGCWATWAMFPLSGTPGPTPGRRSPDRAGTVGAARRVIIGGRPIGAGG
ncbi:MAG: hypothetical protein J2P23_11895, partial [Microlunatus sp.]|nr:hypothetical protein [Microlunatus sp.]